MDIYIKDNKQVIQLPVLPASIEVQQSQSNSSVIVHNFGEVNLKGKRNLYSVSFSSFFPHEKYDFCKCEPLSAYDYVDIFQTWLSNNETLLLTVSGTLISYHVTIEDFTFSEEDGSRDVTFSVTFKEYRNPYQLDLIDVLTAGISLIKEITKNNTVKKVTTKRVSKTVTTNSYKWKKGDTWNKVAKKETGSSANGKALKKQNKKVINQAKKAYRKKHPNAKTIKESVALIGKKVVIKI